jgi:cell wall-associated NlpC family hydrolase
MEAPQELPEVSLPSEARRGPQTPVFRPNQGTPNPPENAVPLSEFPRGTDANSATPEKTEKNAPAAASPEVETSAQLPKRRAPTGMKLKPALKSPEVRQRQLEQLATKFLQETQKIAVCRVGYARRWTPPGTREPLEMDCSNTARYLYQQVARTDIGRTASDQFFELRQRRKAWAVPLDRSGRPDKTYIRDALVPGDLLFWENTYRPQRNPPITHVMIYVGKYGGKWTMVGSQSSRRGGPNIYEFDPWEPSGGYSYKGKRIEGRFVAYGRPLNL